MEAVQVVLVIFVLEAVTMVGLSGKMKKDKPWMRYIEKT
jgi:hypothetical protein